VHSCSGKGLPLVYDGAASSSRAYDAGRRLLLLRGFGGLLSEDDKVLVGFAERELYEADEFRIMSG
jgi:hypothetical protein